MPTASSSGRPAASSRNPRWDVSERLARLADVLVSYSTAVQPGQVVRIEGNPPTAPLIRELYRAVIQAGGHPTGVLIVDEAVEALLADGTDEQVAWVPLDVRWNLEHGDAWIVLDGPENTRHLSGTDPAKMAQRLKAREPYQRQYLERFDRGDFRWVLCSYPTQASAQDAGMSLSQFEKLVDRAAFLDADEPVAAWQAFGERLDGVGASLETKAEL